MIYNNIKKKLFCQILIKNSFFTYILLLLLNIKINKKNKFSYIIQIKPLDISNFNLIIIEYQFFLFLLLYF